MVTGGLVAIGSATCKKLLAYGNSIIICKYAWRMFVIYKPNVGLKRDYLNVFENCSKLFLLRG